MSAAARPRRVQSPSQVFGPVGLLIAQVGRVRFLTAEEEVTLARRVRQGDREARDQLILSNLPFMFRIANIWWNRRQSLSLSDLYQFGVIGLMRAVEKFDPDSGNRFSTYASKLIRSSILRGIQDTGHFIQLPVYVQRLAGKSDEYIARFTEGNSTTYRTHAGKARCLANIRQGERVLRMGRVALEAEDNRDEGHDAGWAVDPGGWPGLVAEAVDGRESDQARVRDAVMDLADPAEQYVIRRLYGMGGRPPATLREIGEEMHLTCRQVMGIRDRALRRLRDTLATMKEER